MTSFLNKIHSALFQPVMEQYLDLVRFPLNELVSPSGKRLLSRCQRELNEDGRFNLDQFLKCSAIERCLQEIEAKLRHSAFRHSRQHNIYFDDHVDGLDSSHPALKRMNTVNHTLCGDLLARSLLERIYEWPPLIEFLVKVLGMSRLFPMADPLARLNVMVYGEGEALNWHFDRAEFATVLLLSAPRQGGLFQISSNLRSDADPNYEGVGELLSGNHESVQTVDLVPGTLNVFRGKNSAHRITQVEGEQPRIIAVFSYCETSDFVFSKEDRIQFYGRSEPIASKSI